MPVRPCSRRSARISRSTWCRPSRRTGHDLSLKSFRMAWSSPYTTLLMSGFAQPPWRRTWMESGFAAVTSSISAIGAPVLFSGGAAGESSYHSPRQGTGHGRHAPSHDRDRPGPPRCRAAHVLTRERLASLTRRRLHGGRNVTKAVVDVVEVDGRSVVVKDVAARPWPVRRLLGPWQLDRDAHAYGALAGARGTPAFLGRIDRQAIVPQDVPRPHPATL